MFIHSLIHTEVTKEYKSNYVLFAIIICIAIYCYIYISMNVTQVNSPCRISRPPSGPGQCGLPRFAGSRAYSLASGCSDGDAGVFTDTKNRTIYKYKI